jgi:prepilin-type N-terminal cleavage/methylation domain-containing protein
MRRGLSLLEVILALSILGVSLAVIGELIRLGTKAGEVARNDTESQLLCESLINEIAAGAQLPEVVTDAPLDELGEWVYSVETQPVDQAGLIAVRVSVRLADASPSGPPAFSLTRWIVDPGVELAAREQEAAMKEEMKNRAAAQASAATASNTNNASGNNSAGGFPGGSMGFPPSGGSQQPGNQQSGNNGPGGGRPNMKLPPGTQLPPNAQLPPGVDLPPGFNPGNFQPGGGGRGGRGGGGGGGPGRGGGGGNGGGGRGGGGQGPGGGGGGRGR